MSFSTWTGAAFRRFCGYLAAAFPGVPIFFVISGFLVSQSYEHSGNIREYARKRALRIFPALWICFAATLALLSTFYWLERFTSLGVALGGERFLLSWGFPLWAMGQLTVGQFHFPGELEGFGVGHTNPSLWTIPVEIGFYVWVPFMYWLIIKRWRPTVSSTVLLGVALFSFLLWYFGPFVSRGMAPSRDVLGPGVASVPTAIRILEQTPLPYLYWFIMGALSWRHLNSIDKLLRDRVLAWTAGYVLLAYSPIWLEAEWIQATAGYQLVLAMGLAMWTLSFALSFRGASHRLLRGVDLSYGLYLFHMLIINALVELGLGGSGALILLVYFLTALLALASWKLVEEPALARKHLASSSWLRRTFRTASQPSRQMGAEKRL